MIRPSRSNAWERAKKQFWDELKKELKKRKQDPDQPDLARRLKLLREHADTKDGEILYHRSPHEVAESRARGGYMTLEKRIDHEARREFWQSFLDETEESQQLEQLREQIGLDRADETR